MASQVEQSVKEAKEELHAKKASEGVEVNTPEKGIVRKTISSIDREMEHGEVSDDVKQLEERISGLEKPDRELSAEPARRTGSSGGHKNSLLSRIASKLGLKSSTDSIEARPVPEEDNSGGWESPRPDFGSAEEGRVEDETIDAPEDIGEHESLDDIPEHTDSEPMPGEADDLELPDESESGHAVDVPVESADGTASQLDIETPADKPLEQEPSNEGELGEEDRRLEAAGAAETAGTDTGPLESPGPGEHHEPEPAIEEQETGHEHIDDEEAGEPGARGDSPAKVQDTEQRVGGEDRVSGVEKELQELEHKMVEGESEELAKISELEERVERLELEDDSDLERRIAELEDRLETIKTPKQLDDRLTELEDLLMNPDRHLEDMVGDGLRKNMKDISQTVQEEKQRLEAEIERLGSDQERVEKAVDGLRESIEALRSDIKQLGDETEANLSEVEDVDQKVERLWEAMDEELASLENQVHDNRTEVEDLLSTLLDLSELVKTAMNQ